MVVLQAVAFLPYLLSGLIAPAPAVLAMRALWVAFAVTAVIAYRRTPRLALLVPVTTFLTGAALLVLGGSFWGWQG